MGTITADATKQLYNSDGSHARRDVVLSFGSSYNSTGNDATTGETLTAASVGLTQIFNVSINEDAGYGFEPLGLDSKKPQASCRIKVFVGGFGTFSATGTAVYSETGSDIKGSANTDLTGAGGAAPTNSALLSALAAADNTTAFTIAAQPDVGRNIGVGINNNTGGPASGNAANYVIVGTWKGAAQNETISFSAGDLTNVGNGNYCYKYGSKPFDTITSITPSAAQPANFRHVAGPGSKIGLYNNLKTPAEADVLKITKNAANLAPTGIVDTTNMTVNLGALADGDDFQIKYSSTSGSTGTISTVKGAEVANGTNLSSDLASVKATVFGY